MKLDKILVPVDFSAASEAALGYALDLAERLGHEVVVLHALGPPAVPVLDGMIIPGPAELAEHIRAAGDRLDAMLKRIDRAGVSVLSKVVQGAPAAEIVRFARDEGCELIVMGTHGRTGWSRLALGSVAELVVRTATVPVLTVRAPEPAEHQVRLPLAPVL